MVVIPDVCEDRCLYHVERKRNEYVQIVNITTEELIMDGFIRYIGKMSSDVRPDGIDDPDRVIFTVLRLSPKYTVVGMMGETHHIESTRNVSRYALNQSIKDKSWNCLQGTNVDMLNAHTTLKFGDYERIFICEDGVHKEIASFFVKDNLLIVDYVNNVDVEMLAYHRRYLSAKLRRKLINLKTGQELHTSKIWAENLSKDGGLPDLLWTTGGVVYIAEAKQCWNDNMTYKCKVHSIGDRGNKSYMGEGQIKLVGRASLFMSIAHISDKRTGDIHNIPRLSFS
jgi:hypothetical protein